MEFTVKDWHSIKQWKTQYGKHEHMEISTWVAAQTDVCIVVDQALSAQLQKSIFLVTVLALMFYQLQYL